MADGRNDIVINAVAETKGAEKSIVTLDDKVNSLAKSSPGLDKVSRSMESVGNATKKAADNSKAMSASFAALTGSINGVITKLGVLGLTIGALKLAWTSAHKEQQRYFDAMKAQAETSQKTFTTLNDSTKSILDNLNKLDKLADGGYLDDNAIQQTNSLVAQLNDLWGDVGLSVDKATGKVTGLKDVTDKLTAELRQMQLEQLALEESVAQSEFNKAQSDYSYWFDENGNLQNAAQGLLIAGNYTGEGSGAYRAELDNKRKSAQAKLLGIQQRRKQIEGNTTAGDVAASISAAEQRQKDDAAAQAAAIAAQKQAQTEFENRLEKARVKLKGIDAEEERLKQELAIAQATGGNVTGAKNALDSYTLGRDRARFAELSSQVSNDRADAFIAEKNYNTSIRDGANDEQLLKDLEALNEANDRLAEHMKELSQIGARIEQADAVEDIPETQTIRTIATGTFNAFGLEGLSQTNIEQQQLQVQKEIAANTKQLARPIVSE